MRSRHPTPSTCRAALGLGDRLVVRRPGPWRRGSTGRSCSDIDAPASGVLLARSVGTRTREHRGDAPRCLVDSVDHEVGAPPRTVSIIQWRSQPPSDPPRSGPGVPRRERRPVRVGDRADRPPSAHRATFRDAAGRVASAVDTLRQALAARACMRGRPRAGRNDVDQRCAGGLLDRGRSEGRSCCSSLASLD
jgi:hypothetical protein